MYAAFLEATNPIATDSVLDVGVTSDGTYEASNYLEAWYPHKSKITAVGLDDAAFLETQYPGVRFVRADGRRLPFKDMSFDIVHSSAVIEHVGSRERQSDFVKELARVARKFVFVTTPNRWYPIEFHTLLPLAHWLPRQAFHSVLRRTGRRAFADDAVLNLLGPRELRQIAAEAVSMKASVRYTWFCGLPSNLLLTMVRNRAVPDFSA
jgi:ubiquinone/menaquinone biosynthesis C-methylase UbiE